MSFSGDMERLQAIIGEFEAHDLSMEESLSLFEEGVSLIKGCREYLNSAKRRVTALVGDEEVEFEASGVTDDTFGIGERKRIDEER